MSKYRVDLIVSEWVSGSGFSYSTCVDSMDVDTIDGLRTVDCIPEMDLAYIKNGESYPEEVVDHQYSLKIYADGDEVDHDIDPIWESDLR